MRWPARWPEAAILVAVAFAFHGVLAGTAHLPYDAEYFHYPLLREVQMWVSSGTLPAWDPYTYGGVPLLANAQAAWLYPPHLLLDAILALLGEPLTEHLLDILVVAHLAAAGLLTAAVARRRGLGPSASAYAGVFVVLFGGTVSQVQHVGLIEALPWVVLSILVVDRLAEGVTAGRVAALAASVAMMIMAGFLPVLPAALTLIIGSGLARVGGRRPALIGALAGGALGMLMAAVVLLPIAALLGVYPPLDPHGSLATNGLTTAVIPNAFGHWESSLTSFTGSSVTNSYFYLGAAALLLLPIALCSGRAALWEAGLVTVLALASFGVLGQRLAHAVEAIPSVGLLWRPEDVAYVAAVPLALLLARALARAPSRGQLAAAAAALVIMATVSFSGGHAEHLHLFGSVPRGMLIALVLVAASLIAARWLATRGRNVTVALAVAALVGGAELAATIPARYFVNAAGAATSAGPTSTGDGSLVLAFLREHTGAGQRVAADVADLPPVWAGFPPVWHLPDANGFQPQFSKYQIDLVHAEAARSQTSNRELPIVPAVRPYLDQMGVRYIVQSTAQNRFAGASGYRLVFRDPTYSVYAPKKTPPRAVSVNSACLRPRGTSDLAACATSLPVAATLPGPGRRRFTLPPTHGRTLLITGEPWYPGWSAADASGALPVRRVGFLAAVSVPPRATVVTMQYGPPGLVVGAILSALSIAGCCLVALRHRIR